MDCAASKLGWCLVTDPGSEPFELRLQIKHPPDTKPYHREPNREQKFYY